MARPTERDVRLVSAYLRTGSTKGAACELGIRDDTYRHRLRRVYLRHGVGSMAQLVYVLRHELPDPTDDALGAKQVTPDD